MKTVDRHPADFVTGNFIRDGRIVFEFVVISSKGSLILSRLKTSEGNSIYTCEVVTSTPIGKDVSRKPKHLGLCVRLQQLDFEFFNRRPRERALTRTRSRICMKPGAHQRMLDRPQCESHRNEP